MGSNSFSGIGSETLIEIQTENFSIIWNVFFSIFKLKLPPLLLKNLQVCVAGWIGPVWPQVSVQASFAIPSLREVSLSHKFSYSIILWTWLFLVAFACSLQTQSHQAKVWCAWQVPDVSYIAKIEKAFCYGYCSEVCHFFFGLFSHLRPCVFATTICNSVLHKRFNCISGTAKQE